jgi:hypothetical protein
MEKARTGAFPIRSIARSWRQTGLRKTVNALTHGWAAMALGLRLGPWRLVWVQ